AVDATAAQQRNAGGESDRPVLPVIVERGEGGRRKEEALVSGRERQRRIVVGTGGAEQPFLGLHVFIRLAHGRAMIDVGVGHGGGLRGHSARGGRRRLVDGRRELER